MKKLIYALRFLTVIPIKWKENEDLGEVARSISYFPLVGLIIGVSNFAVYYLSNLIFSPLFTSVLVLVWWMFITGGLHLDGLADTADGVWGGTTKEKRLEIMKDSRTGVFGVLTLIAFLLLKTVLLNELFSYHDEFSMSILISAPLLGRWISVFSIYFFNSARKDGLGIFFKEKISLKELLISFFITLMTVFLFSGVTGIFTLVLVTMIASLASLFFSKKLGGLTGDIYGALCEISEFLALLFPLILIISGLFL
ncbi:MAG: adenosylcobinamide-GDP ribazoletransferase [Spirochaetaceae bacterium]|jgi:adenosylcobinamide-GDP ribazoletransferase|nr:adenosylcobinamide-GDP ribazoletransferase [Spirochaetaceae bacterium]